MSDFEVIRSVVAEHDAADAAFEATQTEIRNKEASLLVGALLGLADSEGVATPAERIEQKQATGLLIGKLGLTNSLRQVLLEEFPVDPEEEGLRMKKSRQDLGLSLRALAAEIGMPRTNLSSIEEVKYKPVAHAHNETMAKVGRVLGW